MLQWKKISSGKVRDLYVVVSESANDTDWPIDPYMLLLMVATDRLSALDQKLLVKIEDKGKLLCQLSKWWFNWLSNNHTFRISYDGGNKLDCCIQSIENLISNISPCSLSASLSSAAVAEPYLDSEFRLWPACKLDQKSPVLYHHMLSSKLLSNINVDDDRSMLCLKADLVLPVECVVRGYLFGSFAAEYYKYNNDGNSSQISDHLLALGERLPSMSATTGRPLFTPTTKHPDGDLPISDLTQVLGTVNNNELADLVEFWSCELYQRAHKYLLEECDIVLADTKFEFGLVRVVDDNTYYWALVLVDEVLTPDSSRFWPYNQWKETVEWNKANVIGEHLNSQPGTDSMGEIKSKSKSPPSLDKQLIRDYLRKYSSSFPQSILDQTRDNYFKVYEMITKQKPQFADAIGDR